MRLGIFAAIVLIVLSFGVWFSTISNTSVLNEEVTEDIESMMSATEVLQGGSFGIDSVGTIIAAPLTLGESMVTIAWQAFNNPLFTAGGYWAVVPYFTVTPLILVFFFGLLVLLLGLLTKSLT